MELGNIVIPEIVRLNYYNNWELNVKVYPTYIKINSVLYIYILVYIILYFLTESNRKY